MTDKKEFDYSKLRGKAVEVFGTLKNFVSNLHMSYPTFNKKISNTIDFTQQEIEEIIEILGLDKSSVTEYFFKEKS